MSLLNLIPGVAELKTGLIAIGAAALIGGAGYVWFELREVKSLKAEVVELQANNKILTGNNATIQKNFQAADAADKVDQQTIASLLQERAADQVAVANLASQTQANNVIISQLKSQLNTLSQTASNNGTLSVDLKEAIRGIEGMK